MKSVKTPVIWAFDLGKASIGEAIRVGNDFIHKASLLIPEDFASTKEAAKRRRMMRTRQAHKARESWLRKVCKEVGIEVLEGRRVERDPKTKKFTLVKTGDPRLEREFAAEGDPTCYTSCLLRIKLLRGEKLESWQVFKALHSAIQRRGYDPNIPWKTDSESEKDSGKEAKETLQRMNDFQKELHEMTQDQECQYPCYYQAWKMGLWDPKNPQELKDRITCQADSTRKVIIPRGLVQREIWKLVESAALQFPKLKGKAPYVLYGPVGEPYASHNPALRVAHNLKEGSDRDWEGVLGQKIPKFDNRIVEKCLLIPRFNACKIRMENKQPLAKSLLAFEVTFLLKLKNMRFQRGNGVAGLSANEIRQIFEDPKRKSFALTESQWKKLCVRLGGLPLPGHDLVSGPKSSGRSSFSRPALALLKELILSGKSPKEFHKEKASEISKNTDPMKGLVESDLEFLQNMGETWEGLYVANKKLEHLASQSNESGETIRKLIGSQNDPIVRHRLNLLVDRLDELSEQTKSYGPPDEVVLEFVREDFMGQKALIDYRKFLKKREEERKQARLDAEATGLTERSAPFRLELLKAQGGQCLYTGDPLVPSQLSDYVIDHIVPASRGGPDAMVNFVLTTSKANDLKGDKTPYEWLFGREGWDAYLKRVQSRETALRTKKVKLLTSPDALELVDKYTALAETAWISKLAQTIISLYFGWKGSIHEGKRKIRVISGGLTGRIRRKYKLNQILAPLGASEEEAEKKNRKDKRHHALDAMVISFIPSWARDDEKTRFFKFPNEIDPSKLFARHIAEVTPQNICQEKANLLETVYARRTLLGTDRIVLRKPLIDLAMKSGLGGKKTYSLEGGLSAVEKIVDARIRRDVLAFLNTSPDEAGWKSFCESYQIKGGKKGSKVKRIAMEEGDPGEYKDLSKDGTGAWRKGARHKGQIVYMDEKGRVKVRPVYAFESLAAVKTELSSKYGMDFKPHGFYVSGCNVICSLPFSHGTNSLPAGTYKIRSIWASAQVKIESSSGTEVLLPLKTLIAAGMKRL
jgi:CRISPR-associated endonuclease Csn1